MSEEARTILRVYASGLVVTTILWLVNNGLNDWRFGLVWVPIAAIGVSFILSVIYAAGAAIVKSESQH